jgi:hypothetical protein
LEKVKTRQNLFWHLVSPIYFRKKRQDTSDLNLTSSLSFLKHFHILLKKSCHVSKKQKPLQIFHVTFLKCKENRNVFSWQISRILVSFMWHWLKLLFRFIEMFVSDVNMWRKIVRQEVRDLLNVICKNWSLKTKLITRVTTSAVQKPSVILQSFLGKKLSGFGL